MDNKIMNFAASDMQEAPGKPVTTEMMIARQAQEVQAAMVIAKQFPRDQNQAFTGIMTACRRPSLASQAMYEFPRGNTVIRGPSIRLAEAIAQQWGNLETGWFELERRPGESKVLAYCWDLQTNTRNTLTFTVQHVRETRKGNYPLTDPRDIYEMLANQAARRKRACILGIVPGDVVEAAVEQCKKTLASGSDVPLVDRIRKMVDVFQSEFGVSVPMLESYMGFKVTAFTEQSLIRLISVYKSIQDGVASREQYFPEVAYTPTAGASSPDTAAPAASETPTPEPAPDQAAEPVDLASL